jgi:uncharacterized repeat protein (TIGR03806 family)
MGRWPTAHGRKIGSAASRRGAVWLIGCGCCALLAGCTASAPVPPDSLPDKLSELGLYAGKLDLLTPATGTVPYALNSGAFFDDALVDRVLRWPAGEVIVYGDGGSLEFPIGTILAQTLFYPVDRREPRGKRRLVETRVLLRRSDRWLGASYLWNDEQSDAELAIVGDRVSVAWRQADGTPCEYSLPVPDANGCKRCHKLAGTVVPLGLTAKQLNRSLPPQLGSENQLGFWSRQGWLRGLPDVDAIPRLACWNDPRSGSVEQRARAWLDVNCAHCHSTTGPALNSGLHLSASVKRPVEYGVFKTPVAAGRGSGNLTYDIAPGKPDQSILVHRITATESGTVMPEFGRSLVDAEGVALIREWIQGLAESSLSAGADLVGEVRELTPEELQHWAADVRLSGDRRRGEELFYRDDLNCLKCHAVAGAGGDIGPDLTRWETVPSLEQLVESVLLPNKNVRPGYATLTVQVDDGRVISGKKVREDDGSLVLRDPYRGDTVIPTATIESRSEGGTLMPTGVVSRLTRPDVLDLIAFLSELSTIPADRVANHETVRSWRVLAQAPPGFEALDAGRLPAWLGRTEGLVWQNAYSRLSGALPLNSVPAPDDGRRRLVRCRFVVRKPGHLALDLQAPGVQAVWLDDRRVSVAELGDAQVEAGPYRMTILIEHAQGSAGELACRRRTNQPGDAEIELLNVAPFATDDQ